ncbi:MAG: hypothetical protein KGH87_07180, partial [Thaumarchaeota archaeon]|nr:hypothetical protein [Nitrososphaerota archaeon]
LYQMADDIGDLRVIMETILREMFKNGAKVKPVFKYKCLECLKEFDEKPLSKQMPQLQQQRPTMGEDKPNPFESKEKPEGKPEEKKKPFGKEFPPKKGDKKESTNNVDKPQEGKPIFESNQSHGDASSHEDFECDECGNTDPLKFDKPNPKNRAILQAFLKEDFVNYNKQSIMDLAKMYERDLDVVDQAYTVVLKDYKIYNLKKPDELTGAIRDINPAETKISEFLNLSTTQTNLLADNEGRLGYDSNKNPIWICPDYNHRDKHLKLPYCDRCGCKALNGIVESNMIPYGLAVSDPKKMTYAMEEVIWTSGKYKPDMLYGYSPIQSIWKKAMSLFHQDEYIWKYFDKDRPPKALLMIGSRNYESAQAFMERQRQGAKNDPYMPRVITVNNDDANKGVNYIDLTPNFKELELTDLRSELRQIMCALYGVTPIYTGGNTGSSGLGDNGLQVTLTNRAMKYYQSILNDKFFGQITRRIFKIYDWQIVLDDVEEIDELRKEQIIGERIKNAAAMHGMGFPVYTDGNGKVMWAQFPDPQLQQQQSGAGQFGQPKTKQQGGVKEEKATSFEGEPLPAVPSDDGGQASGSPSAGFSHSNKAYK